ncbi:helix-turn-helix domain-containing protein [Nocardioides sp. SR21]|uniref:helix-turn-helix domain-containing protein n=1 Tax=Nocardioides sp. SR21 TaxID=2919501 RepID=UPI001FA96615|nr:helix-turn-helix transcriptional regulator [Nocardioides sp. SR21]
MTAPLEADPVGAQVRRWRERRRRSQLDLSLAADVSTRHLSYVETGRSRPSPTLIERLCDELDVPLRERNRLHLAAGYAPPHPQRGFVDLGAARTAIDAVLTGLEPHPALAVDAHWNLVAANRAARAFFDDLPAELLTPPVNVLRATLHPDGLAARIRNLAEWRGVVLGRVRRQLDRTGDPALAELLTELRDYPAPPGHEDTGAATASHPLVVPLRLAAGEGELAFSYTTTVFGSPRDVTLDEIAIEAFLPADERTAAALRDAS